LAVRLRLGPQF